MAPPQGNNISSDSFRLAPKLGDIKITAPMLLLWSWLASQVANVPPVDAPMTITVSPSRLPISSASTASLSSPLTESFPMALPSRPCPRRRVYKEIGTQGAGDKLA